MADARVVQRKTIDGMQAGQPASIAAAPNRTGLPDGLKHGIETLSGLSMDDVNVHYNSSRPTQINARAYAEGNDIHVSAGQEHHVPHEAWHVVQQRQGRVRPTRQMSGGVQINDDAGLEREADEMGAHALRQARADTGPVQRARQGISAPSVARQLKSGVVQRISDQARLALQNQFMANVGTLYIGKLTAKSTLRDFETSSICKVMPGTYIVYQGNLRDNFSKGPTSVQKDHVYAAVVSDAAGQMQATNQWRQGWIVYENVETQMVASAALHVAAPQNTVAATVDGYLQAFQPGALNRDRRDMAPRAIKAWAEKHQDPLTGTMPLLNLGLQAADLNNAVNNQYDTIDAQGVLGLDRVAHQSQFFQDAQQFLGLNAAAMPGTMAKDHELRHDRNGGPRAQLGRAWLGSYPNRNLNDADVVAITGANVTNIFVNRNAPTWAAYQANLQHLHNAQGPRQITAPKENWQASQSIRGQGADALIDTMTKGGAGEYYLFHGTSAQNVFNISKSGFDPEFVNYTSFKGYGKTGYGTAFTDQFAKALAYAPPEAVQGLNGQVTYKHYVLVARVLAGRTHQVGNKGRRTRGNLEMTQHNINYEEARGNKMKAQGQGMSLLGKSSDTVAESYTRNTPLHSTVQDRDFDLSIPQEGHRPAQQLNYRDTSLTISDAIQMYPAYIIECVIPDNHIRKARRTTT